MSCDKPSLKKAHPHFCCETEKRKLSSWLKPHDLVFLLEGVLFNSSKLLWILDLISVTAGSQEPENTQSPLNPHEPLHILHCCCNQPHLEQDPTDVNHICLLEKKKLSHHQSERCTLDSKHNTGLRLRPDIRSRLVRVLPAVSDTWAAHLQLHI